MFASAVRLVDWQKSVVKHEVLRKFEIPAVNSSPSAGLKRNISAQKTGSKILRQKYLRNRAVLEKNLYRYRCSQVRALE